ncbi:DUF2207 domain-containing protein [Parenemella sanctibonifatiensis]|uniref:DUF2207 domain-containing protein n=1 Tax=Parenemella sanctibonifatiensis TaxID=2016505 RepID=A0A255E7X5_9ACTN|nr:DUF2207 domain-containing protein [Parenemella sanctibonifatiensis]OYN87659.1 hypothetical protein CGZ92_08155 [Parenemella sanctibonifatiensis]
MPPTIDVPAARQLTPPTGRPGMPTTARWVGVLLATLALTLGLFVPAAPSAYAQSDDLYENLDLTYAIQEDGTVDVTMDVTLRFGSNSGRHGLEMRLPIREPYDPSGGGGSSDQDRTYDYSNFDVSSPDNVSTKLSKTEVPDGDHAGWLRLRIGDPDRTIKSDTVTYTITYEADGLLTTYEGIEFYYDALYAGGNPAIASSTITVESPSSAPVEDLRCVRGSDSSQTDCDQFDFSGTTVTVSNSNLADDEGITLAAQYPLGSIQNAEPNLIPADTPNGDQSMSLSSVEWPIIGGLFAVVAAIAAAVVGLARKYWLKDERFLGAPPGTIPPNPEEAEVGRDPGNLEIPVTFSPPPISVGEAGLLQDGQWDVTEITGTLVALAVKGALRLDPERKQVTLVDRNVADRPEERVLLNALFNNRGPGTEASLDSHTLHSANEQMSEAVRATVDKAGWFKSLSMSKAARRGSSFGGIAILLILGYNFIGGAGLNVLLAAAAIAIPVILAYSVYRAAKKRGQRTAVGRALTDQIEGFRLYLSTAEANQLKFEEGEDIYSKYLPWAIVFGLTERWTKICQQLVDLGRLSDQEPYWYSGTGSFWMNYAIWNSFTHSMHSATTPEPPAPDTSGWGGSSGFGSGGSGFGGGGISIGGGGGGMSSGSW